MSRTLDERLRAELADIEAQGLTKSELAIRSPQAAEVRTDAGALLNFCANNYLGLANDPVLRDAAKAAIDSHGLGMASVRFICGTQDIHKALEAELSAFLGTEDTILFASCFDANAGLFESLLGPEDAIISDALNHASIIDGVRLCKARRYRYANNDMAELEARLKEAADARTRLIVTDGVFSMDGILANLPAICDLAERHDAIVMVDDSHAVGFVGPRGAGTPDHWGVADRVQILTGTFGKALGGAAGGYVAASQPVVDMLRQRARPYLFSNALPPAVVEATRRALQLVQDSAGSRARLADNAKRFRAGMEAAGFDLVPGEHAIIPVMLGEARLAADMAAELRSAGIYVTAFSYPVVPKGQARIRTQMNAAHSPAEIDRAIAAFTAAGRKLGVIA
ncbi:glycine C-acetyltransferase [Oceanomicrobium pacificus]|uniref:2-amino-3-ketobutyrate coenzyme A ligase n=1 Tax=Oceanomicrobium pacificus TaxID=2692916 RepID=A0A6B0TRC5_9RHOB|nr:glycine C-acetyltransferase [Oceanomicrobium pacificus]MXU63914.1 glycine C-acetyltransferase [Oceanomicrobium pacificus]